MGLEILKKVSYHLLENGLKNKLQPTFALAIWPAGRLAIERMECYWAVVSADENQLSNIFYNETLYIYQALVAGQTQP